MKLLRCLGQIVTSVVLLSAMTAHAENVIQSLEEDSLQERVIGDDSDSSTSMSHYPPSGGYYSYCQQYTDPRQCERVQGCQYSRIYSQCLSIDHGGGGGGPVQPVPSNYCSRYNYEYQQCVSAGCQFDGPSGQCYTGQQPHPQPHPQPQPNYCSRYNYNQYQCESSQGCFYDYRSGACSQQGGGYPQPVRGYVCTAADDYYENHGGAAHTGRGRTNYDASRQAMYECNRYHQTCVVTSCRQD